MDKSLLLATLLSTFLFLAPGCGKSDPAEAPTSDPKVLTGMSSQDRASRCFLFADPETNQQARQAFIDQLKGSWQYYPLGTDTNRRTFKFDTDRAVVTVSEYYSSGGSNIDDITYKKLCVSKPLDSSRGLTPAFASSK